MNATDPPTQALSFGSVADAYDRARPAYADEAVRWLAGGDSLRVLELGAGTGKLTRSLVDHGHHVIATDPIPEMVRHLSANVPEARVVQATAEEIPLPSRSVDVVIAAQAFHWFDHGRAVPEMARVLRPGGALALVWNLRDSAIPWVRRLGTLIGVQEALADPALTLGGTTDFGWLEEKRFRFWQQLDKPALRDLVTSRSNVAIMAPAERERLLDDVGVLYDEYKRGADGMQLPYVTRCFRTVVNERAGLASDTEDRPRHGSGPEGSAVEDTDALLIDFR